MREVVITIANFRCDRVASEGKMKRTIEGTSFSRSWHCRVMKSAENNAGSPKLWKASFHAEYRHRDKSKTYWRGRYHKRAFVIVVSIIFIIVVVIAHGCRLVKEKLVVSSSSSFFSLSYCHDPNLQTLTAGP
jgi:hypothetical protein